MAFIDYYTNSSTNTSSNYTTFFSDEPWFKELKVKKFVEKKFMISEEGPFQNSKKEFKFDPEELVL